MSEIQVRYTVESLFALKSKILANVEIMRSLDTACSVDMQSIGGHAVWQVGRGYDRYQQNDKNTVDQAMWRFLSRQFNLQKYMLCTDWDAMQKEIQECRTPEFTVENANAWLDGLKELIHANVQTLVKDVYARVVSGTYRVGSGYNADKKKRNNNGIDRHFIIRTNDYSTVFAYWDQPTITDDLEKVCYLLDGKTLPEKTLKTMMKADRVSNGENDYMRVEFCKNGNTHFYLRDDIRDKLNRYGPDGTTIGENIKIKVF